MCIKGKHLRVMKKWNENLVSVLLRYILLSYGDEKIHLLYHFFFMIFSYYIPCCTDFDNGNVRAQVSFQIIGLKRLARLKSLECVDTLEQRFFNFFSRAPFGV